VNTKTFEAAHARGAAIEARARAALYGARHTPRTNAGTAADAATVGRGKHSVWQGPRQILSGAPVLRRNQT
jgi:hypothetical protein